MRALALVGITVAILGCQTGPKRTTYEVRANSTVEPTADVKCNEIHVNVPQQDVVAHSNAGHAPLSGSGAFSQTFRRSQPYIRTYRAVGLGWLGIPIPVPKIHSIPVAVQPNAAAIAVRSYAPQQCVATECASHGIHPATLQQYAGNQSSSATLQKLLTEIEAANKSKAQLAQQKQEVELAQKANSLEKRIDVLLKQLNQPSSSGQISRSPVPSTPEAISGAGYSPTSGSGSTLRSPVEQVVGAQTDVSNTAPSLTAPSLDPVSARTGSSIEMWPHRPQSMR